VKPCPAFPDKLQFATETEAKQKAEKVFQAHGEVQRIYFCEQCGGYHLTSQSGDSRGMENSRRVLTNPILIKKRRGDLDIQQQDILLSLHKEGLTSTQIHDRLPDWGLTKKQITSKLRYLLGGKTRESFPTARQAAVIDLYTKGTAQKKIASELKEEAKFVKSTIAYYRKKNKKDGTSVPTIAKDSISDGIFEVVRDNEGFIIRKENSAIWLSANEVLRLIGVTTQIQ
jgi:hypothetical protein